MSSARDVAGTVGDHDERSLIEVLLRACPTRPSPEGPGDDAAVIPGGARHVLTTDALIEGTHFVRAHPPMSLGWKTLAVNLSDVAAMGAVPEAFVLAVALPAELPMAWWRAFAQGLGAFASMHEVHLAGGDTVRAGGPLMLTVSAWGRAPEVKAGLLLRSGGQPGDLLMVAGPIGRSGHGLAAWLELTRRLPPSWAAADAMPPDPERLEQHLQPSPPLWAGPWALAHGASAGMDLSDGLAADLPRLAEASQVILEVDLDSLPADDLLTDLDPRLRAAYGEDYSLVVLVPPPAAVAFQAQGFVAIGRAIAGKTAPLATNGVLWRLDGRDVAPVTPSFSHFR